MDAIAIKNFIEETRRQMQIVKQNRGQRQSEESGNRQTGIT